MDRLLVLHLEARGCRAEAVYNGLPLLRLDAAAGGRAWTTVHEYTSQGRNHLELVIEPGPPLLAMPLPQARLADGQGAARLTLLLPRVGASISPSSSRCLADLGWAPPAEDLWQSPLRLAVEVEVPAAFPRWRWMDLPEMADPAVVPPLIDRWLLELVHALARGNPEPLIQASRLRLEDLALAYQTPLTELVNRWRQHWRDLHATALPLGAPLPGPDTLGLRPVAQGRLLDCLSADGRTPFLTLPRPDGGALQWPLRVGVIDGRCFALR